MHGRVKVRTSEEENARKEKERQEKLKKFKYAMEKITAKRNKLELDRELLELTEKVISSNPDIYTIWNVRRDILNILKKETEAKELSLLYDAELNLTEYCLKINPKSYSAWHQREWVLTSRADPDWNKELSLCNTYLKLDERNFHTWDYRRFVVRQSKPSLKDEFDFTTEKIYENFSNYSAWHYRSKMLLELYPDLEGGRPIEDSHHKQELKLVQSAAFTDPDDTSAWFYQRWLLGAVKTMIELVVYAVTPSKTTIAFSKHVNQSFVECRTSLVINNLKVKGHWYSCTGNQYDVLWIFTHNVEITENLKITVEYEKESGETQIVSAALVDKLFYVGRNKIDFQRKYSKPVIEELSNQLESCRQLLSMEPDNKCTLLTTTIFLHCIDSQKYHNEAINNLRILKSIDKLRAGYYCDLITKWSIENQLYSDYKNKSTLFKLMFNEPLLSLPHLQYYSYCKEVDLSNRNLSSIVLPSLILLQHCKKICLKDNNLTTLKKFPPLELEELDLQGNEKLYNKEVELFKGKVNYNILY